MSWPLCMASCMHACSPCNFSADSARGHTKIKPGNSIQSVLMRAFYCQKFSFLLICRANLLHAARVFIPYTPVLVDTPKYTSSHQAGWIEKWIWTWSHRMTTILLMRWNTVWSIVFFFSFGAYQLLCRVPTYSWHSRWFKLGWWTWFQFGRFDWFQLGTTHRRC